MNNLIELTDADFDARLREAKGLVLVDFYAPWCGPCRLLAPWLEELAAEFAGRVTVAKVNVDEAPELAVRYGISGVPTLILFESGRPMDRVVGLLPPKALRAWVQEALARQVAPAKA